MSEHDFAARLECAITRSAKVVRMIEGRAEPERSDGAYPRRSKHLGSPTATLDLWFLLQRHEPRRSGRPTAPQNWTDPSLVTHRT
jgi:hypothetical protein